MSEYEGLYHIRMKKTDGGKTILIRSDDIKIELNRDKNEVKIMIGDEDDLIKLPPIFSVDILIPVDKLDYVIAKLNEIKDKLLGSEAKA